MPVIQMVEVFPEQVDELAALAKPIWTDHFTPIIGAEQTAYMIEKFQSAPAMRAQMANEGYHYYFFLYDGQKAGYTGIRRDGDSLFLSKIYVEKSFRRKGIASHGIAFMTDLCRPRRIAENLAHGQQAQRRLHRLLPVGGALPSPIRS